MHQQQACSGSIRNTANDVSGTSGLNSWLQRVSICTLRSEISYIQSVLRTTHYVQYSIGRL